MTRSTGPFPKRARARAVALLSVVLLASAASPDGAAAQQAARVYEMRTYTAPEGRLDDVIDRFRRDSMRLLAKYGMESVGYWVPQDSALAKNTLVYILAHPTREAARENWRAFFADSEWLEVRARTEANGPIVARVESVFLDPTDFSPLR